MKKKVIEKEDKIVVSEELAEKLQYVRICKDCSVLKRDMVVWRKKRCPLCRSLTKRLKIGVQENAAGLDIKKLKDTTKTEIIKLIVSRTRDFDCPGEVSNIVEGPVVTEYEFTPDKYTRLNKLKSLNEDLALALSVDTVSIRRIPGKPLIGIQIPNKVRQEVTFASCLKNTFDNADSMEIPLNFGIMSDGSPYVEDLSKYPHLLIGGSTGTGKSVFLHQLITNLMLVRSPKQVQMMMIDPKTVELFSYKSIPHMLMPPVSRVWMVMDCLAELVKIMKERTEVMHNYKVVNIKEFNAIHKAKAAGFRKEGRKDWAREQMDKCWPYIVVIIDEMAEIVLEEKRGFILHMATIAQMARAAGISIISATQRPSVDVLPGKIKVNFLARAALRMPSPQDSKTVLNFKGAETLLGKGDMFVLSPDKSGLQRIHIPLCTAEDRDAIIKRAVTWGYDDDGRLLEAPVEDKVKEKKKASAE